jgi:LmbE family N-acetylglucosaminyl deacetylase
MVKMVREVIDRVKPDIIYVPHRNDAHSDHGVTFDVLTGATKTFRSPSIDKVLAYEVISETEFAPQFKESAFLPNSFSDITGYIDRKIKIMARYKGELGRHPFPRSVKNIKALATFRGATAGARYAEAFMVLKERW